MLASLLTKAQQMRIGIYHNQRVSKVTISPVEGEYQLFGDTSFLRTVLPGEKITLKYNGTKVQWLQVTGGVKLFQKITFLPIGQQARLKFTPNVSKTRIYEEGAELFSHKSKLRIVNLVGMNNYLSGVIESEGGGGKHINYYKVQALMSRTYAMKNRQRHRKDGFQLCDGVHCQAYHSELRHTASIRKAVEETNGEVIVDSNTKLVSTYFSANCGGQTCDASYVWNTSVSYLESFIDTFCIHTWQATWMKKIKKTTWVSFLKNEYGVTENEVGELLFNFEQEQRKAFFIHPSLGIPLRDIRRKFKLKSTFFSTHLEGEYIVLNGRGFGHGVGLCQEGAMNMAKSGYDYRQIALFYFHNVRVVNYYKTLFFEQEEIGL